MNETGITYDETVFIYAYLRHLDLSLDRSRWGLWKEFMEYSTNILSPDQFLDYFKNKLRLSTSELIKFQVDKKENNLIDNVGQKLVGQPLTDIELIYALQLVLKYKEFLTQDITEYNAFIEELRISIAQFNSRTLQTYLTSKETLRLSKLEHFNQNIEGEVLLLSDFSPK